MTKDKLIGTSLLLGGFASILSGILLVNAWLASPLPIKEAVTLKIKKGMSGQEIAQLLEDGNVINSARTFRWALWIKGAERSLKRGTVKLQPPLSLNELIDRLRTKRPLLIRVQLQEGWPSWRIFSRLSTKLKLPEERFEELFDNPKFLRQMGISSQTLEGYLFPDTYFISADASPEAVLEQIIGRFREIQHQIRLRKKARRRNLTLNEAVSIASIIAREASLDRERTLVSAVYHNRLEDRIPLQADPTVLYPTGNFQATITHSMLRSNNPYNTYQRKGLPPTPICNPGKASLHASVTPANVPYRYFVSKGNGKHVFSETLEEHRKAVQRYQR